MSKVKLTEKDLERLHNMLFFYRESCEFCQSERAFKATKKICDALEIKLVELEVS